MRHFGKTCFWWSWTEKNDCKHLYKSKIINLLNSVTTEIKVLFMRHSYIWHFIKHNTCESNLKEWQLKPREVHSWNRKWLWLVARDDKCRSDLSLCFDLHGHRTQTTWGKQVVCDFGLNTSNVTGVCGSQVTGTGGPVWGHLVDEVWRVVQRETAARREVRRVWRQRRSKTQTTSVMATAAFFKKRGVVE